MKNIMNIKGYQALISYDAEINMFRGEFISLNGGADFYANDIEGLIREGELSLNIFLKMCQEDGVSPEKQYSGKFNVRLPSDLHKNLAICASARGQSINQLIIESLKKQVNVS